jgi:hypothetical protein
MNRFEQLIEYVINDESQKASELFHDIVVEKSRQIYENLMQEEDQEDLEEAKDEDLEEAADDELDEGMMGGDASDDLIDDVETEEQQDMSMEGEDDADAAFDDEAEEAGDDLTGDLEASHDEFGSDEGGSDEPASKDDILNLEDKLDQLMAEFEELMGGGADLGNGDGFGPDEGGDAIAVDDTEEMMPMAEAISLKAAPKPVTAEQGNGKAGPVAFNSGATGMASKPVHTGASEGGHHDTPAYRNTTKDLIGKVGNTPAQGTQDLKPANKPHLGQASGVNTKSPLPSGRKG